MILYATHSFCQVAKEYTYYKTQHEDVFFCVVNQIIKNKNLITDGTSKIKVASPIFHPYSQHWDEGYLGYIFVEGEMIAPLVFNIRKHAKPGLKRKFECMDKIVLSQLL